MVTPRRSLFLAMLALTSSANAQVELVDPDAPTVRAPKSRPKAPPPDEVDADPQEPDAVEPPTEPTVRPAKAPTSKESPAPPADSKRREAEHHLDKPPEPLKLERVSDADLEQAWLRWKKVEGGSNIKAEQAARAGLVALKKTVGASDLEPWAMGLLRASAAHEAKGDSGAAVELAMTAAELAPSLPAAWSGLARAYFEADPSDLGRFLSAMGAAASRELVEPRYRRAAMADVATVFLVAWLLTSAAVVLVLFARRAYYFLYDFHFLFPRAAARWQTTSAALLLLSLPLVFRMGVAPVLLGFFAASALYLSVRERLVAAMLIASLGLVPTLGALTVEATAFAETPAATLAAIERGGTVEPAARRLEALAAEDKAGFAELYVLGRHHLRRGQLDKAIGSLRKALAMKPDDVGARVNMGVAFFLMGDLENSRAVLEAVTKDHRTAAGLYDLGRVYQRRVAVYGESAAAEVDKGMSALAQAAELDPSLPRPSSEERPFELGANQLVRTVPLDPELLLAQASAADAATRVRSQLTHLVLGELPEPVGPLYPLVLAALLFALGFMGPTLQVSKECTRCGMAVSTRGDPDVSRGSPMCTQCINVFAKKNVVAPSLKVRKQLEVARYAARRERTALVLGALCAGMGQVFSGATVRGAVFAFSFFSTVVFAVFRQGVLRAPYDAVPGVLKLGPLVAVALVMYLGSLRELRKGQG